MEIPNLDDCYEDLEEALAAAVLGKDMKLIEKLLDMGVDPTQEYWNEVSPLELAAEADSVDIIKLFEAKGLSVSDHSVDIFEAAIGGGGRNVVSYVLSKEGVDVNCRNFGWDTPLHLAADAGDSKIIQVLLAAGADPTAVTKDEDTPLDIALQKDNTDSAKLLIKFTKDLSPYKEEFPDLVKFEEKRRVKEIMDKMHTLSEI